MINYPDFVTAIAKSLPTQKERLEHAYIGVCGEIGELADTWKKHTIYEQPLDMANILEELGDLRFYIQIILNEVPGVPIPEDRRIARDTLNNLLGSVGFVYSLNNLSPDSHLFLIHLGYLTASFHQLCINFNFTEEDVIKANITKLKTRYPKGTFTVKHAAERLDKKG